jgi:mannan endo-1,4-beta-mannosidase
MLHLYRNGLSFLFVLCTVFVQAQTCSDNLATPLTQKLYKHLFQLKDAYTIFGHQDDMAYGVGWRGITGKSDIHDVVQDYPGLHGFDIANIELGLSKNIDGVPFKDIRSKILDAYARGGVSTISWHVGNPLTGKNAWDTTHETVSSILPGGAQHQKYIIWLDRVAAFLQSLKTTDGNVIPVLFRPFHELTGTWFWWGKNNCTPEQFIALWNFTQDYLIKTKNIHHLIYVYNTADFDNAESFLQRYPGDSRIDMLSFDRYQYEGEHGRATFLQVMNKQLEILTKVAADKQKIAAIAETGYEAIPDPEWWTGTLYPLLQKYPVSHVLVWRNAGFMKSTKKMHYYAPYPGQVSEANFKLFYTYPKMLFEKQLATKNIYQ